MWRTVKDGILTPRFLRVISCRNVAGRSANVDALDLPGRLVRDPKNPIAGSPVHRTDRDARGLGLGERDGRATFALASRIGGVLGGPLPHVRRRWHARPLHSATGGAAEHLHVSAQAVNADALPAALKVLVPRGGQHQADEGHANRSADRYGYFLHAEKMRLQPPAMQAANMRKA